MAPSGGSIMAFDAFPKTLDDLKERTLGGAAVSVAATILIAVLFVSEFRQYRLIETVDKLDVDVSSTHAKIAINLDITLPALPCSEFVVDAVDASGVQQMRLTDALSKLRIDRHGVPIDVPKAVDWAHTVAPAFRHRKVLSLLESVTGSLRETLGEIDADVEVEEAAQAHAGDGEHVEGVPHTHDEHLAYRRMLAHRAMALQHKLDAVSSIAQPTAALSDFAHMSREEIRDIKARIDESRLYSAQQAEHVSANLDAMERNLLKLQAGAEGASVSNLQEALKIRLDILADNLRGFVSPSDIDRRDSYSDMALLVHRVLNSTRLLELGDDERSAVLDAAETMQQSLDELKAGASGTARARAERALSRSVELVREALEGAPLPADYCGSCYGAEREASPCCNTCDEVKAAYRAKRWGVLDEAQYEQCRREAKLHHATQAEGEGCNVFGSIEVHPSSGMLHLAPASTAQHTASGAALPALDGVRHADVAHFNASHTINRLSFGDDFPGQLNPLDGVVRISPHGPGVARYFIKVVPTTYLPLRGQEVRSNQFASTEHFRSVREDDRLFQMPGVHFSYDITPLRVRLEERRGRTFVSFFVRCAATIGGVFTVAGMIDKILYSSSRLLTHKLNIGKAS
ncbi:hypothetical protein KFE25_000396 [Diacronema lutheri]|uniref:Endoplasmic reticulum vesicle transporter C-terminal domain-containing protein n=2 Tax=Diacronema lutheri TaxID=2081491 RepID=A0A8J5XX76_DIALT|nr:hypothetical protein KFE25_000396 [Diacronema lutheri]